MSDYYYSDNEDNAVVNSNTNNLYSSEYFVETEAGDFDADEGILTVGKNTRRGGGAAAKNTRKYRANSAAGAAAGTSISSRYYKSNYIGKKIVYGDTGIITNHIVGSSDEDLYFKVRLSGRIFFPGEEKDYVTLFYDNPRDYCIHYLMKIQRNSKEKRKHDTPELFEKQVDEMLYSMDSLIRVWGNKRNAALMNSKMDILSKTVEENIVIH